MPRIDPLQLLQCLKILLTPDGGILSLNEVQRLTGLMSKFSKKLVSKCIYVLILRKTERNLLDSFMELGGWNLVQTWLQDATNNQNWPLVVELLELLLVTPVDVARLKSYSVPKMVKGLSKREDLETVCKLSNQLVQQWLKIVKDETQKDTERQNSVIVITATPKAIIKADKDVDITVKPQLECLEKAISTKTFYDSSSTVNSEPTSIDNVKSKEEKEEDKKKSHDKDKHRSSSKSSSRDKERSSSHKSKDRRSSSSSSSRSRDHKDRDKKDKDKDRHRSNGSLKSNSSSKSSSSNSSSKHREKDKKESKEKQAERDKDTLAKIQPQSLLKLPKIPKKSEEKEKSKEEKEKSKEEKEKGKEGKDSKAEEPKKGSISIEVRKNDEERPKTVKVYKSKMRLTGLEEESKPAPPRSVKKPSTTPVIPPLVAIKRSSPPRDSTSTPPEKKPKIEVPLERPGAIKLIPPKPKPAVLQESDMFMDALTASATTKKEPKKRKRRASVSKDSAANSPPESPTIKNMTPPKFYQDTLDTEEPKTEEKSEEKDPMDTSFEESESSMDTSTTSVKQKIEAEEVEEEITEARVKHTNGLRGVLVYSKRKGPKKSIKWKSDDELVDIQYFELDETERVNVTKTFGDMAKMDLRSERELIQLSRKLPNEDVMDVHTNWKVPMEIDLIEPLALPGSKSLEKDIQFAREKSVLQALYFHKRMLPDSPAEPDLENYQVKDPIMISIEDSDPDHDYRNTPWPEPKGSPPQITSMPNNPTPIFPNVPQVAFQNFGVGQPPVPFPNLNMPNNMQQFTPGPQFMQPNVMGGAEWNNGNVGPMPNMPMMHPNMGPPDMINQQGPMNPNLFMQPQENFNPMMGDNNHRFPPPFNQQGPGGPGMFPPNNFNMNRGGHNSGVGGGGGFRRGGGGGGGGSGPWLRMNGPPPPGAWNNMRGGGGGGRGGVRLCNNIRNKGFCRNRDTTCQFFHPNN